MKLVTIKLDKYKPHPKNPNTHPDTQLVELGRSLEQYGQFKNVVVWNGYYLAGHGLVEAAKRNGLNELEAVDVSHLSEQHAVSLMVADNRLPELSIIDDDVLAEVFAYLDDPLDVPGIDDTYLDALLEPEMPTVVEDEPPVDMAEELAEEYNVKPGQLWLLGQHRLVCVNCTDPAVLKKLLGGRQADMVWTDPPYGVDYDAVWHGTHTTTRSVNIANDSITLDNLSKFIEASFTLTFNHCRPGCVWYVTSSPGKEFMVFGRVLEKLKLWRQTIAWVKNRLIPSRSDFNNRYELMFYGWKDGKHYFCGDLTLDTVWEIRRPDKSKEHPTMKPVELVAKALHCSSRKGDLVLDPFGGSGTTLLAAEQLGRRACLVEINPGYVGVTLKRFEEKTCQKVVLSSQ